MLVLSRTCDEAIMIGDDIRVTVVDIRGDKVRLGVTAPRHVKVHRQEVFDAIQRENVEAARLEPGQIGVVFEGCTASSPDGMTPTVAGEAAASTERTTVKAPGADSTLTKKRVRRTVPVRRPKANTEFVVKA